MYQFAARQTRGHGRWTNDPHRPGDRLRLSDVTGRSRHEVEVAGTSGYVAALGYRGAQRASETALRKREEHCCVCSQNRGDRQQPDVEYQQRRRHFSLLRGPMTITPSESQSQQK
ncbi:hypothetical protein RHA1_ro05283 [Rhodococcus jostii RHA1]|uniref:Uncharacterized protein n=1 Tax=Rhodococcus jostii (strain RHA1) TaxID=101510 RepID=Q0S5X2_RHOJR|nr:hypothetical protein RHA1_ro05283 [Rhodococcus jostii RHA1]